jgi:hypothetical protein
MTIKSDKEYVSELNNEWNDIDIEKIRNDDIKRREKTKRGANILVKSYMKCTRGHTHTENQNLLS